MAVRQARNREALVQAGYSVMSEKGIDAATMQEIAELADVGAGTVYSYFKSKEELAVAVIERVMHNLAVRIAEVGDTFADPAQVYAYGVRTVIDAATGDLRWRQLLNRPEVIAEAMFRIHGPFAIRDIENAVRAGRFTLPDARLNFKLACYAIVGVSVAIVQGEMGSGNRTGGRSTTMHGGAPGSRRGRTRQSAPTAARAGKAQDLTNVILQAAF